MYALSGVCFNHVGVSRSPAHTPPFYGCGNSRSGNAEIGCCTRRVIICFMTTEKRTYAERKEYLRQWEVKNREKRKASQKAWYEQNKEKNQAKGYRWRSKVRFSFQEFKATLKCAHCGENDPVCLDFHHLDPTQKDRNVTKGMSSWSYKRIMEEVEKCIVLCANCHRKEHKRLKDMAANNQSSAT